MPFSLLSAGVKTSRGQEEEETRTLHCLGDEIGCDAQFWTRNQAIFPSRELVLLLCKTFFSITVVVVDS